MARHARVRAAWLLPCCLLAACGGPQQAPGGFAGPPEEGSPAATAPGGLPQQVLERNFQAALQSVQSPACLRRDQEAWEARTRQSCGGDAACLDRSRIARARLLEGLLPGALLDDGAGAQADDDDGARLIAVVGNDPGADGREAEAEGRPYESEGGFLLAGDGFDAGAFAEFESMLGDEDALRARYGDGPVVFEGLRATLSVEPFDGAGLAVIESVAVRGGSLRVRGTAAYDADGVPAFGGDGCLFVYEVAAPAR